MKKRDFLGYATVTDYLIANGVMFHPDTVILQVDDINSDAKRFSYESVVSGVCRPIFAYQTIEQILELGDIKLGRLQYVMFLPDVQYALITIFNITDQIIACGEDILPFGFEDNGHLIQSAYLSIDNFNYSKLELPDYVHPKIGRDEMLEDSVFALAVFGVIHEGFEVEEVTLPRNYRRRIKNATGKLPSNHYRIRRIMRTRKRYLTNSIGIGGKRSEHIVRGHFRHVENHPIQQFNGDWWIPAHYRGGDKNKSKSKPVYRIEL